MNSNQFTSEEITPLLGIILSVTSILIYNYGRGYREFWSPLTIIAIVYAYYCCLGPYEAVLTGETSDRLLNMRKFYVSGFYGALISLLAYAGGFGLHGGTKFATPVPNMSVEVLFDYGRKIFIIGFVLFTISTKGRVTALINPLDAGYVPKAGGTLGNYLGLSLNFLIPAVTLLFLYFLKTKKKLLWFLITFTISAGIFTTLGFRYRLVLLVASCAIVYYYHVKRRPNLIVLVVGLVSLITIMGAINMTRKYGSGLDIGKLKGATTESSYKSGLQEAGVFQTSGAIIDLIPERYPHAGLQPVISTLLFPIPSVLYPEKNSAEYLFGALDSVYGKKYSEGAAIMAFGEYYLAFGWAGIIVGCFLTGWFLRKLWNWFLANSDNYFVVACYAVSVSFLYVILSRGYLPQVTTLFFFTVFPIFVALRYARKKYGQQNLPWRKG